MRYLTPALIVLLMVSLIANGVMYLKFRSGRAILSVNGVGLSKFDLDTHLESVYGADYKANFVRRTLIHRAAIKNNVAMTQVEVNQKFKEAKQLQWTYANTVNSSPWLALEAQNTIQEQMEMARLRAKDISVTSDDIRDEYNLQPARYDTPSKAETEVALLKKGVHTNEILQLMSTGGTNTQVRAVNPSAIMANYRGEVRFIGDNNVFTFIQHFGTAEQSMVFNMKEGQVLQVPTQQVPREIKQAGYSIMLIRLIKIHPGHKADLVDPKLKPDDPRQKDYIATQELLRLTVALKRANPGQELLRTLYQNAKIEAEEQTDIDYIKLRLFPPDDTTQVTRPK